MFICGDIEVIVPWRIVPVLVERQFSIRAMRGWLAG